MSRRRLIILIVLIALGVPTVAWVLRRQLLRAAARAWVVNDSPTAADAAVVLGGGLQTRAYQASCLYRDGLVRHILLLNTQTNVTDLIGVTRWETGFTRDVLLTNQVPESAIEIIGSGVENTYEEC